MTNSTFKYEVAFSFLAQDEALATQLNDLLQDRMSTFLYSKRQEQLAGTDGEITFNKVFGEEARCIVVLYRKGWGETPWTRIEETAIRGRAYNEGYGFVKFIPLDDSPSVPQWLPPTQIWIGLKRWGIETTAGVIDARVQELGGQPHEESVTDRAARLSRELDFKHQREAFMSSVEGVQGALQSFEELAQEAKRLAEEVVSSSSLRIVYKRKQQSVVLLGLSTGLLIDWSYKYSNSLDGSRLEASFWNGHPPFPGVNFWETPQELGSHVFDFDLLPTREATWVSRRDKQVFPSLRLAEHLLKLYMDRG